MIHSKNELFSIIKQYPIHRRLVNLCDKILNISNIEMKYQEIEQCYEVGLFKEKSLYYGLRIFLLPHKILFYFVYHFLLLDITYTCEHNVGKNQQISYNTVFNYNKYQNSKYWKYKETSRFDRLQNEVKRYIQRKRNGVETYESIIHCFEYVIRSEEINGEKSYYIYYLSKEEQNRQNLGGFYLPYPMDKMNESSFKEKQKKKE